MFQKHFETFSFISDHT